MKTNYALVPVNDAEESFRFLLKHPLLHTAKADLLHNLKNMCYHSSIRNIFTHYLVSSSAKVEYRSMAIEDTFDAVVIKLLPNRKGVRKAELVLSTDSGVFIPEIHVYYHTVGKVIYPVKYDNLHNTMLLAITD